ncbi:SAM pointed domain-containing Ets transcription factor isoform X1 [Dasypus novemcinctus]|nr:SAM pointed domain-containing Ets transcription factor isoform X2 [Dasypus novemcinctus]XP_058162576.1 SAM pointed domain-containing Ets transcription factor isoform X2 [Dasypus novemcinctus]
MGSASPGPSGAPGSRLLLPADAGLRPGPEKGATGPPRRDWSPSPPTTPEQGLPAFYLSYFDMLYPEDGGWTAKGPGAGARGEPPEEPEQCPIIDSQAPGGGLDLAPGALALEEHSLEQVQSMVVGEVLKDIETACKLLNITAATPASVRQGHPTSGPLHLLHPQPGQPLSSRLASCSSSLEWLQLNPVDWSPSNVQKWLLWTEHQYRLPPVGRAFQELGGKELCAMSEEQFRQRSPLGGDVLHAHLDIWKSAAWMKERTSPGPVHYCASAGEESWTDSEVDSSCSGQPIHLWQFLKELLLKPHSYGRFIRWLNKEKGIFKIEDSAQVARLWGVRKNRPAMNYDKLSRSIRQYYKKGIIRKPDVSQRLVYQFVHPI